MKHVLQVFRDFENNKLCKFGLVIFSLVEAKFFSTAALWSKILTKRKGKWASEMCRLLFAKSLTILICILYPAICLFAQNQDLSKPSDNSNMSEAPFIHLKNMM